MAFSSDKENPNPVIHSTQKRNRVGEPSDAPVLGSQSIRRYELGSKPPLRYETYDYLDIETSLPTLPTTEERLVAIALSEIAYSNRSKTSIDSGVDIISPQLELLHNAGFPLLQSNLLQKTLKFPSFTPSGMSKTTQNSLHKRDSFTASEVFDIIRNIQDPEHPLSLEQLNVVRLDLIKVVDAHPDITNDAASEGISNTKFSTVCVQFT